MVGAGAVVALLAAALLQRGELEQAPRSAALAALAWGYAGLLPAAVVALRERAGWQWVVLLFVVTWANDTLAYFAGRFLGKRPLAPRISPKKTWEGFCGRRRRERARCTRGEGALPPRTCRSRPRCWWAPAAAVLGPLGDLSESHAQAGRRREGLRQGHPRARRAARPHRRGALRGPLGGRLRPVVPADEAPLHPRLHRLHRRPGPRRGGALAGALRRWWRSRPGATSSGWPSRSAPSARCWSSVSDAAAAAALRERLGRTPRRSWHGEAGAVAVASLPEVDFVLAAISGGAGLRSTAAAVEAGKPVGLANKESLVLAGELLMRAGRRAGRRHPAGRQRAQRHLPVAGRPQPAPRCAGSSSPPRAARCGSVPGRASCPRSRPAEALRHPNWSMGAKITIDSATLMNKGLEVIEARWLFDVEPGRIDILVHPESIVHSMVEYVDGRWWPSWASPTCAAPSATRSATPSGCRSTCRRSTWRGWAASPSSPPTRPASRPSRSPTGRSRWAAPPRRSSPAPTRAAVEAFLAGRCRFDAIARVCAEVLEAHRAGAARLGGPGHRRLRLGAGRGGAAGRADPG